CQNQRNGKDAQYVESHCRGSGHGNIRQRALKRQSERISRVMEIDCDRNDEGDREQSERETSRAQPRNEEDNCQSQKLRGEFHVLRPISRSAQAETPSARRAARVADGRVRILSIASAGHALANRKPCISPQPASRNSTRCSLVSTPSASTFMPSAWPSVTI